MRILKNYARIILKQKIVIKSIEKNIISIGTVHDYLLCKKIAETRHLFLVVAKIYFEGLFNA